MAEQKRKNGWLWFSCIAFLLIAALYSAVSITTANEIPHILEYSRSRLSAGITFSYVEKMPGATYGENLALCSEMDPQTVGDLGEIKPVLVNQYYFDVYNIHVGGSAVTEEHITKKIPAVVISDKAAFRMSPDADVVGRTVTLYDREFTIVGIYRKPDGFLREVSSDVYDRVYIPYTCYDGWQEVSVDTLASPKGTYYAKAIRLLGLTGSDTGFYLENDLAVKQEMIANFTDFFIAVIAVILAILALRIIASLIRASHRRLREEYQALYLSALLRKEWLFLLSRVLIITALIAVPVILLILFPPKLVLPLNYIPYDNIFELKHYLNTFIEQMQLTNAELAVGNGYYARLSFHVIILLSLLFLLLIPLFLSIITRLRAMIRSKKA